MSMVINLVEDHNIYLCEGGPVYNGGVQPTPITYLTQWKIVGNSEVHGNEIWSCGEYNATDGKYHILVQPLGGSIVDIALTEPLRKVNDVADTIEFPSNTDGKALVTRSTSSIDLGTCNYGPAANGFYSDKVKNLALKPQSGQSMDVLCTAYPNSEKTWVAGCMGITSSGSIWIGDKSYESATAIKNALAGVEMIYKLATPTTELVDAPQIEEADSYSMVISQGAKAIEWSSFETE